MTTRETTPAETAEAEFLRRAVRDVAAAVKGLDGEIEDKELRKAIFMRLLDERLSNGSAAPAANGGSAYDAEAWDEQQGDSANRAVEVARFLDIPPDRATELFDLDGPIPVLVVKASRLAKTRAEAVRQIAPLLTAARTALNLPTGANDIRAAAQHYGKFDGHFSELIESCEGIGVRGQPGSPNRRIQLLAPGVEEAKRIAQDLLE